MLYSYYFVLFIVHMYTYVYIIIIIIIITIIFELIWSSFKISVPLGSYLVFVKSSSFFML